MEIFSRQAVENHGGIIVSGVDGRDRTVGGAEGVEYGNVTPASNSVPNSSRVVQLVELH